MLTLLQLQQSPLHETCPTQSGSHVTRPCDLHSKYEKNNYHVSQHFSNMFLQRAVVPKRSFPGMGQKFPGTVTNWVQVRFRGPIRLLFVFVLLLVVHLQSRGWITRSYVRGWVRGGTGRVGERQEGILVLVFVL